MNKKKKKIMIISLIVIVIIAIAVAVILLTTGDKTDDDRKNNEVTSEVKESAYKMSGNALENFDLYFLQLENEKVNKIYSPLSIKYALAMLSEGAAGNSKAQIDSVIGDYVAKKYTNNAHMSFANAMFIKNTFKEAVNEDYTTNLANKFNAEIIYDSFATPDNLNNWVSDKTFDLIQDLFDDNVSAQDFVLVNALAIDMEWKQLIQATSNTPENIYSVDYDHENFNMYISPIDGDMYSSVEFNDNSMNAKAVEIGAAVNNYDIINALGEENIRQTVGAEYDKWLAEGGCGMGTDPDTATYLDTYIEELGSNYKQVDTSTDFLFYDDEEIKAFAKDLKEYDGTTLQYIGIMPKSVSLDQYIEDLNANKVTTVINNLKDIKAENFKEGVVTKITGYIPLFKFDYELKLMDDLKELGITDVFDINQADLSGIVADSPVFINSATHKANIEFSNEGIKAAAATQMGGMGSAGCWFEYNYDVPVETIDLTFDSPYLFLIRDKDSGEVWFMGTVYNPLPNE